MGEFLKKHQQRIAIVLGYAVVFSLAFGLGKMTTILPHPPEIKVEEPAQPVLLNHTPETLTPQPIPVVAGSQTKAPPAKAGNGECGGKIKGNISAAGKVYHLPADSFYKRTHAEACFDTEQQAQAAGFRRSKR